MPRKATAVIFGVFDERAVSVLTVLDEAALAFGRIRHETGLSKASLFRTLRRLREADLVRATSRGYLLSRSGSEVVRFVDRVTRRQTNAAISSIEQRVGEMEREYRRDRRIFHENPLWERTRDKAMAEVMAVAGLTGEESLLFHQRFQEGVRHEEWRLQRRSSSRH